jgi:hypothetical protein
LAGDLQKPKTRALITSAGHRITIDEDGNSISLEHAGGGKIEITNSEITLESGLGKVVLSASGININNNALTVS